MAKKHRPNSELKEILKSIKKEMAENDREDLIALGKEVLSRFGEGKDVQVSKDKKVTAEDALRYFHSGKVKLSAVHTTDPLNRGL